MTISIIMLAKQTKSKAVYDFIHCYFSTPGIVSTKSKFDKSIKNESPITFRQIHTSELWVRHFKVA
jgi:hypothetical protein